MFISGSLLMVQRVIETPWNVSELQFLGRALSQTNNILDWGTINLFQQANLGALVHVQEVEAKS